MDETSDKTEVKDTKEEKKSKAKLLEDKIEKLKEKMQQLQARKQQIEDKEKAKTDKKERAKETRRKVLLGGVLLSRVDKGNWTLAQLLDVANELTRDSDRALFGLPPLPPASK